MENLTDIRPAQYVSPQFFTTAGIPREGVDGYYALAMAYHARNAGLTAEDLEQFREALAESIGPEFRGMSPDAPLSDAVRQKVKEAGEPWRGRCAPLAELLDLSADALTNWRSFAALLAHLERINAQVALLGVFSRSASA